MVYKYFRHRGGAAFDFGGADVSFIPSVRFPAMSRVAQ
jgi:hypothetical protein